MTSSQTRRFAPLLVVLTVLCLLLTLGGNALAKPAKKPAAKPLAKAHVIIALGFGHSAEARPRPAMAQRVLAAVDAWKKKKAPYLLFCGGYTAGHVAEAEEMKIMATALGVPEKAILLERASMSTQQNARYAAEILDAKGMKTAFLVTHKDHLPRALKDFRKKTRLKRIEGLSAEEYQVDPPKLNYAMPLPEVQEVEAVVIHARSLNLKAGSDGAFVDAEQAELARTMGDLVRRGFGVLPILIWHPAAGIGHILRSEAIGIASVVFGVPSTTWQLAPARRFSPEGEAPGVVELCQARGWTRVLAILPAARSDELEKVRLLYEGAGIQAVVLTVGTP